ncbi:phage holin family protein [Dysgonomonas sp. 25]|uniref:phage holin family protein n=1 Tax=Dysgonomonas sp. 25 TaxID=2302933 RepID=UPI0013D3C85C|nr:phage holin family protein [Dysgonomonas sp. 25]NDV69269.1 holin [Dysgonomonas sp. 25]
MHTLLFINPFLSGDSTTLRTQLAIVGIMWLFVAIAIIIDLISGVRKAKERGEVRTSYGFKQTVNKAVLYFAFMLFAFMFDCIGMFFYPLPIVTLIAAAFLIFIECKSVFEKANDKDKRKFNRSLNELVTLLENRDDLLKAISEITKKQEGENEKDR